MKNSIQEVLYKGITFTVEYDTNDKCWRSVYKSPSYTLKSSGQEVEECIESMQKQLDFIVG